MARKNVSLRAVRCGGRRSNPVVFSRDCFAVLAMTKELRPRNDTCKRASALLIALILMSILVVLALGFNAAIIRQTRTERQVIEAGQAFYAAEAGIERGLWDLETNLPGFESRAVSGQAGSQAINFDYSVLSQSANVPCNFEALNLPPEDEIKWETLAPNQTARIPLFKDDGLGGKRNLAEFRVHFYVDNHVSNFAEGDVLRWKIIGQENFSGVLRTQSISDFYPEDEASNFEDVGNVLRVSAFGTDAPNGLYTVAKNFTVDEEAGTGSYIFYEDYPIAKFLNEHMNNTLILTNVIDLSQQIYTSTDYEDNFIVYRLVSPESEDANYDPDTAQNELVCDFARVAANAAVNDSKQSLDVTVKLDSFLPVFDFALYRTKR